MQDDRLIESLEIYICISIRYRKNVTNAELKLTITNIENVI